MKRSLILLVALLFGSTASAQLPQIRITAVFPPGGQAGTTLDVAVTTGSDLDEADALVFSHPGLKATPKKDGNGNLIANQFAVTIDSAVQPGLYDVRLRGLFGISNPRIFRVDSLPEAPEKEGNNTKEQAQEVAVNTIVNGRSNGAADVDHFAIPVKAGQTIVVRSEAACLDSLMQPVLELFTADGRRVAHARRRRNRDAVLVHAVEADQTMSLRVRDTVFAGSNDYVYRLSIDTREQIDAVAPHVVHEGIDSTVTVFGRALEGGEPTDLTLDGMPVLKKSVTIKVQPEALAVGTDSAAASTDAVVFAGISGNLLQLVTRDSGVQPVTEEPGQAAFQKISVPTDFGGSFEKELDQDTIRFAAKQGDVWQIEVFAQRIGSNADPLLIVEQVTVAKDGTETVKRLAREEAGRINPGGAHLPTLTTDPAFTLTAPADGLYQLRLRDRYAASRGDKSLAYTVSIQKPAPSFRLVAFDSLPAPDGKAPPATGAVSIRKGGTYQIPIYAYRSGGHKSAISVTVDGLPTGVTCAPIEIPAGSSTGMLVFSATADCGEVTAPARIIGKSNSEEQTQEATARVATLAHGGINGLPRTARASSSLLVSVMKDEQPFHVDPGITTADMTQDQQLLIPLKLTRRAGFDNKVDITFVGQPGNVDVPKVSIEKGKDAAVARLYFKENAAVGPATLQMHVTGQVPYRRNPWQVDRAKAGVTAAVARLDAANKSLVAAKAKGDKAAKRVAELTAMLGELEKQLAADVAAEAKAQKDLKAAVAQKTEATKQLVALQEKLNVAAANTKPENTELDAAIKAVEEAGDAVLAAAKPVSVLTRQLKDLSASITLMKAALTEKQKQIASARAAMMAQQKAVDTAKAEVATAGAAVKAGDAAKKAAEAAVKKAEDASKPQNRNYRTVTVPVRLLVHKTPGKIAAAVPGGGAIKKGAAIDVKVTLTRKNNFAGPAKVSLVLPAGVSGVTSNTVDIPADQTEATLKLTASADAAAADIANAVIRATADFEGRQASFDAPITLKVTE